MARTARTRPRTITDRVPYRGYEILPDSEITGVAWINYCDLPHGRVSGQPSVAAAVTAAKQEIDRWEAPHDRRRSLPVPSGGARPRQQQIDGWKLPRANTNSPGHHAERDHQGRHADAATHRALDRR
jgi:hypothetical protein